MIVHNQLIDLMMILDCSIDLSVFIVFYGYCKRSLEDVLNAGSSVKKPVGIQHAICRHPLIG